MSQSPSLGVPCGSNDELAVLQLNVGESPQHVGYSLTCDNDDHHNKLWDAPVGSFSTPLDSITETLCVDAHLFSCTLFISGGGSDKGTFEFSVGSTTIGLSPQGFPMPSAGYCFGPKCRQVPYDDIQNEKATKGVPATATSDNAPGTVLIGGWLVFLTTVSVLLIVGIVVLRRRKNRAVQSASGESEKNVETETVTMEEDGMA